jgi:hypothetical protein
VAVLCLSPHADYRCQRSGACCTAGWPIPVEIDRLTLWREALASGRLAPPAGETTSTGPLVVPADRPPGLGAVLRTRASGACAFYRGEDGLCAVQRELGHAALPVACQHFPRRCLIETGRVAVSLSHFCPTVARAAFRSDVETAVVAAPASLAGGFALEGLDAREALPPLLRPGLLADLETCHAWERFVLDTLAREAAPESALASISALTDDLRTWTPGAGPLRARLDTLVLQRSASAAPNATGTFDVAAHLGACDTVRASVPAAFRAAVPASSGPGEVADADARWVADAWPAFSGPLRRFLAAHAFGSWCAYNGQGLRTVVESLVVALRVVRVEAGRACARSGRALDEDLLIESLRAADLLLVHLANPMELAKRLGAAERRSRQG